MRTSRRRFLEISSAVGLMLPSGVLSATGPNHGSRRRPAGEEQGQLRTSQTGLLSPPISDLSDWTKRGSGRWSVNQGEVVATGDGWLLFNQKLEDFVLKFLFQCTTGDVGILLRSAPTAWSRFS